MPMAEMGVAFTVDRDDFVMLNVDLQCWNKFTVSQSYRRGAGAWCSAYRGTVFLAMGVSL